MTRPAAGKDHVETDRAAAVRPLLVVTGTGTGIGKTHVADALLRAWARALSACGVEKPQVAGLKPVESGVTEGGASDAATLEQASTFHVKRFPPPYMLRRAVSPHLAALDEAVTIEVAVIRRYVSDVRALCDGVVLELAGGLFSPLGDALSNADVARDLDPTALLLVAPDRLGVLHDVAAATRAAKTEGLRVTGLVLVAPEVADASTGTNAGQMRVVTDVPVLAELPRAPAAHLAEREDLIAIVRAMVSDRLAEAARS